RRTGLLASGALALCAGNLRRRTTGQSGSPWQGLPRRMTRTRPWRRALAAVLMTAAVAPATAAAPRVASYGLCADQMALMLADRAQIAAVSDQATSPLSHYADRAKGLPVTRGSAEEIIASGAQVFLTSDNLNPY